MFFHLTSTPRMACKTACRALWDTLQALWVVKQIKFGRARLSFSRIYMSRFAGVACPAEFPSRKPCISKLVPTMKSAPFQRVLKHLAEGSLRVVLLRIIRLERVSVRNGKGVARAYQRCSNYCLSTSLDQGVIGKATWACVRRLWQILCA